MIVITTPAGMIGHQVLESLLDGKEPLRVIARDASALPTELRDRVDVIEGSHGDRQVLSRAFEGADSLFWLCPPDPKAASVEAAYVGFTRPLAETLNGSSVTRVVGVSALGRGTPLAEHAGYATGSLHMDDLIAGTGVGYRALVNPSFMDNIARQGAALKNRSTFFGPINGDRKLPFVATCDIASVAAQLLLDREWQGVEEVPILGPEDMSFNDMAATLSHVLETPVRYQEISFDAYKSQFVEFGMSDAMAQGMTDMAAAKDKGLDNAATRTTETSTPTSFRQWCEDVLAPGLED